MVEGCLVVPDGPGSFTARAAGREWVGATSRSAKVQAARALRKALGTVQIEWTLQLPVGIAADVAAYKALERGRARGERQGVLALRLTVARELLECRLSVLEAAKVLGIHPGKLAQKLGETPEVKNTSPSF